MHKIIDFHTHAFPDEIAEKAITLLQEEGDVKANLDGRLSSLISSMDKCGISKSVICAIATKPSQFDPILAWCKKIRSDRIIPFPSLHPDDSDVFARIDDIKKNGFKGIKLHPYYQNFNLDDKKLFPIYEKISSENLIIVMHTGFDIAFERIRRADPEKIVRVMESFPSLKLVTTHLGSWDDWDEVEKHIIGKDIYMEISFSLELLDKHHARNLISRHSKEYVLFGTDSPWTDQYKTLSLLRELGLDEKTESLILSENAARLLNSV
ncbi:MAG: amidohydrolase family protein [Nitrospiraceae bacterium]|nr:amidohydrolase family protein [Nitrospiraceae bacterium]